MTTVYAEVEQCETNWRAGIVLEKNGLWTCPGIDEFHTTEAEAKDAAYWMMMDYAEEAEDQGEEITIGGFSEYKS